MRGLYVDVLGLKLNEHKEPIKALSNNASMSYSGEMENVHIGFSFLSPPSGSHLTKGHSKSRLFPAMFSLSVTVWAQDIKLMAFGPSGKCSACVVGPRRCEQECPGDRHVSDIWLRHPLPPTTPPNTRRHTHTHTHTHRPPHASTPPLTSISALHSLFSLSILSHPRHSLSLSLSLSLTLVSVSAGLALSAFSALHRSNRQGK